MSWASFVDIVPEILAAIAVLASLWLIHHAYSAFQRSQRIAKQMEWVKYAFGSVRLLEKPRRDKLIQLGLNMAPANVGDLRILAAVEYYMFGRDVIAGDMAYRQSPPDELQFGFDQGHTASVILQVYGCQRWHGCTFRWDGESGDVVVQHQLFTSGGVKVAEGIVLAITDDSSAIELRTTHQRCPILRIPMSNIQSIAELHHALGNRTLSDPFVRAMITQSTTNWQRGQELMRERQLVCDRDS